MRVVVLGAGLIGVASAWYLAEDGHDVTVADRQPGPANETSFANGGQISTSHAEPWANPGAPMKVLRWLGRADAPLLWRLRADPAQWAWGLRFLAECLPGRARANTVAILRLALESRALLKALRPALGLEYDSLSRGILHFYTDEAEFDHAISQAALMRESGCDREVKTAAECLDIEPALGRSTLPIVGGTFTAGDESGDARKFTLALAAACAARGVKFRHGAAVEGLIRKGNAVTGARLAGGERLAADAFVIALGSWSPLLARPMGIGIPVFPAKGYSATLPLASLASEGVAPTVSLTDDGAKLVFSRLGDRLRVAGTAEFAGYDTSLDAVRCEALARRTFALFPGLASLRPTTEFWAGLRPSTPGNVPIVGRATLSNLWINTGHGTLGWTLACGSGRLLADLVGGRAPAIDPAPYSP
ncbi:MAG: D-amino acid dehydrogenase [Candidatus Nitricoxidivorans perseverans]|uniref:D-amino acid dehydrogenase n=1 Tax=Candidatus Nitricoxidivorans perseverans TaxID=2975601 RepID=A0AA49J063_9PROT|nr:MAG: D-amino acid dehydrogenase [Candidatus Nitricoxidivorans perseverans]